MRKQLVKVTELEFYSQEFFHMDSLGFFLCMLSAVHSIVMRNKCFLLVPLSLSGRQMERQIDIYLSLSLTSLPLPGKVRKPQKGLFYSAFKGTLISVSEGVYLAFMSE